MQLKLQVLHHSRKDLPDAIVKKWIKLGLTEEDIIGHLDLIFHISWFIEREEFAKDFQVYERLGDTNTRYCTDADSTLASMLQLCHKLNNL